ncbi:MAG: hypothetical protein WCJ37_03525 [Syntrophus sp. (in: bacteria)]
MIKVIGCAVVITLLLCGCTTHVVSSNPRNVLVAVYFKDIETGQRLADAECAKHNRHARMAIKGERGPFRDHTYSFDCVD